MPLDLGKLPVQQTVGKVFSWHRGEVTSCRVRFDPSRKVDSRRSNGFHVKALPSHFAVADKKATEQRRPFFHTRTPSRMMSTLMKRSNETELIRGIIISSYSYYFHERLVLS